jgi:hypothetical protein
VLQSSFAIWFANESRGKQHSVSANWVESCHPAIALDHGEPLRSQSAHCLKKEAPTGGDPTIDCHRCVPVLMMDQSEERARFFP